MVRAPDPEQDELRGRAVECDIFNTDTLTWFYAEKVFCDLTLVGLDGAEVPCVVG